MIITLTRTFKKSDYTIGKLTLNGNYICDTLEDTDRGLDFLMKLEDILKIKVKGKTSIPKGVYKINMDTVSGRFGSNSYYKSICNGKVPRLESVKGYSGVLIHCGNTDEDTEGCILVGTNNVKGMVTNSRKAFEKLYNILKKVNEPIYLRIV